MVSSIQHTDGASRKKGYTKSIAIGAVSGYTLKYLIPITPQEKDANYMQQVNKINKNVAEIRNNEIIALRGIENKSEGIDTFLKMYDSKCLNNKDINKLPEGIKKEVFGIAHQLSQKVSEAHNYGHKVLTYTTKAIRQTGIFMAIGAAIGLTIALLKNVSNNMTEAD